MWMTYLKYERFVVISVQGYLRRGCNRRSMTRNQTSRSNKGTVPIPDDDPCIKETSASERQRNADISKSKPETAVSQNQRNVHTRQNRKTAASQRKRSPDSRQNSKPAAGQYERVVFDMPNRDTADSQKLPTADNNSQHHRKGIFNRIKTVLKLFSRNCTYSWYILTYIIQKTTSVFKSWSLVYNECRPFICSIIHFLVLLLLYCFYTNTDRGIFFIYFKNDASMMLDDKADTGCASRVRIS